MAGIMTQGESGSPRYCHNWALSRRGRLTLYDDRLEFDEWIIAYRDFQDAVPYESRQMLIPRLYGNLWDLLQPKG